MPQDFPVEASDTLAFTPPSLAHLEKPPVFYLRAATMREKRFRMRLLREAMLETHDKRALREETLKGLRKVWTPAQFEEHSPRITEYWQEIDDFILQRQDDPDLELGIEQEEVERIESLFREVARRHTPLARMHADNADYEDMLPVATIAVAVESWEGFDVTPDMDRGYLTLDCVNAIDEKLIDLRSNDGHRGASARIAWLELYVAAEQRFSLSQEEAKNSESPSPSKTAPAPSSENGPKDGTSPASAISKKTRKSG